jgi:hypothetical protein
MLKPQENAHVRVAARDMDVRRLIPLPAAALAALLIPNLAAGQGTVDPTVPAARDAEAVVLTGAQLGIGGSWSVPANLSLRQPEADLTECQAHVDPGALGDPTQGGAGTVGQVVSPGCPEGYDTHNHYAEPTVDTATVTGGRVEGTPTVKLLGYRWDAKRGKFRQIPFQVDEVFTRYLNNTASGFAIYSGEDQHTTYAYDREGFRFTQSDGADSSDPCTARMKPGDHAATDPVKGLDSNDELAFMATDAGPAAPAGAKLPDGVTGMKTVTLTDPTNPSSAPSYVYILRSGEKGPKPAYSARDGYVRYQRDDSAEWFAYSQSSYGDYGAAAKGYYCDEDGHVVRDANGAPKIGQRRPRDTATITTDRYRFRYDGRWLMTKVQIAKRKGRGYGPDLVDRWKARAFAQDPGSQTPCCGYEEEDTNWGGSSILLGERVGPVRAIRETWGADSGTNVIRRETFYRDQMVQKNWLRVHVIPPLDGIYAQWDFNAGRVNRFYNAQHPSGVPIDGRNDEVYGNLDDPCNERWDANDSRSDLDNSYRELYRSAGGCDAAQALGQLPGGDYYHQSVDPGDATFADANAALGWSEVAGPHGTIVDRIQSSPFDLTPGGAAQSVAAVPYYRDDACFDDGTGSDPGPVLNLRSDTETKTFAGAPRRCWKPSDGTPPGDARYYQGSIGTHGLHLLFLADSDNARQTVPLTEIVSDWHMVLLPGDQGNVGERYGRSFEKPLVALVQ